MDLEICVIKRVRGRPLDRDPTIQMSSARLNQNRYNTLINAHVLMISGAPGVHAIEAW